MSTQDAHVARRATEGSFPSSRGGHGSMGALETRSKDTQAAALSLGMLNEGYRSREDACAGGRGVREEEERPSLAPETPQRAARPNPGTPLTPLANLKVLIAAASTALEQECASGGRGGDGMDEGGAGDDGGGRKMKSLSVLCQRFLAIAETEVGVGNDFSLELMSQNLGTNRRRIYDIINVLEALEMIVKQSKNWYTWLGKESLLLTLAKMRAMAQDDPDFKHLRNDENCPPTSSKSTEGHHHTPLPLADKTNLQESSSSTTTKSTSKSNKISESSLEAVLKMTDDQELTPVTMCGENMTPVCGACGGNTNGGRWDKSLGVLCQKFVMLFLVTPDHEVTLDYAGNMLMPDCVESMGNPFAAIHQPTNPKTKVRRLYDIANVLTTLGLIKKKTFMAPNHRKMPGYAWSGPTMEQIQAIPVFRKNEFNLYPFYSKKKGAGSSLGGVGLTRKGSFGANGGVRPFLHQYEVKGQESAKVPDKKVADDASDQGKHSSAPTSPVKSRVVRRTLSFGAQPTKGGSKRINRHPSFGSVSSSTTNYVPIAPAIPPPTTTSKCVVARPLAPKQVDYMNEVKEFEAEMRKHSHKFPHVASVFQEFIQKYQATLEQAGSVGRTILPKPVSLDDIPSVGYGNPQTSSNLLTSTQIVPASVLLQVEDAQNGEQKYSQPSSTAMDIGCGNQQHSGVSDAGIVHTSSNPPPLIQLGDIDVNSVANAEDIALEALPSGRLSPPPTSPSSSTYGVLKSPGPTGTTSFMNVQDVMIPSPNQAKGTQTSVNGAQISSSSDIVSAPSVSTKSTMLTALLKNSSGNTTQPPAPATQNNPVVQQVLVSQLLNSLVNQNPIPTPSAFKKPAPAANSRTAVPMAQAPPIKVPPTVHCTPLQLPRSVSLPNPFNPSAFLAGQAQQPTVGTASSGAFLTSNAVLPNVALSQYLPTMYRNGMVQAPASNTTAVIAQPFNVSCDKPSSPKKPRLG